MFHLKSLKRKFICTIGSLLALTISILFYLLYSEAEKTLYARVDEQSKALLQQVIITRAWIAEHEGIYIRRGPGVENNTFMPGTEIKDEQGREYVFHNPALAVRKLSEYASQEGLYRFHMSSLKPLNPTNAATPFETLALQEFERRGYPESRNGFASVLNSDKERFFQRIIPLKVERACLRCHEQQGYREGEIRGGLSVILPMADLDRQVANGRLVFGLTGLAIFLAVIGTIYLLLQRMVLTPVSHLEAVTSRLAAGNYSLRANLATNDEFERLGASINAMTDNVMGSYQSAVKILAAAVEARDPYTRGHIDRVARYAVALAHELQLEPELVPRLEMAAILHDIGKIGVPDEILRKSGLLSQEEIATMQGHALKGIEIVAESEFFAPVIPAILHHHEHYDGSGYPHGLRGEEIPLLARIIAVADAFDAMVFDRPYRQGLPLYDVLAELKQQAGRQFDASVVAALFALYKSGRIPGISHPE